MSDRRHYDKDRPGRGGADNPVLTIDVAPIRAGFCQKRDRNSDSNPTAGGRASISNGGLGRETRQRSLADHPARSAWASEGPTAADPHPSP